MPFWPREADALNKGEGEWQMTVRICNYNFNDQS